MEEFQNSFDSSRVFLSDIAYTYDIDPKPMSDDKIFATIVEHVKRAQEKAKITSIITLDSYPFHYVYKDSILDIVDVEKNDFKDDEGKALPLDDAIVIMRRICALHLINYIIERNSDHTTTITTYFETIPSLKTPEAYHNLLDSIKLYTVTTPSERSKKVKEKEFSKLDTNVLNLSGNTVWNYYASQVLKQQINEYPIHITRRVFCEFQIDKNGKKSTFIYIFLSNKQSVFLKDLDLFFKLENLSGAEGIIPITLRYMNHSTKDYSAHACFVYFNQTTKRAVFFNPHGDLTKQRGDFQEVDAMARRQFVQLFRKHKIDFDPIENACPNLQRLEYICRDISNVPVTGIGLCATWIFVAMQGFIIGQKSGLSLEAVTGRLLKDGCTTFGMINLYITKVSELFHKDCPELAVRLLKKQNKEGRMITIPELENEADLRQCIEAKGISMDALL